MTYIKRMILCLLVCILSISIIGCFGNTQKNTDNFDGVVITTKNSEFPKDIDKIDIAITNNTDKDIYYLPDFSLEKNIDGKWESVKKDRENSEDVICGANKGTTVEDIFYVHNCYESLSEGDYRLVVYVSDDADNINDRENAAYAEFTIK